LGEFLRKIRAKGAGGILSEDMAWDRKEAVSSLLRLCLVSDKDATSRFMAGVPKLVPPNNLFCFVDEMGGGGFSS
jgi:hypothetical protein